MAQVGNDRLSVLTQILNLNSMEDAKFKHLLLLTAFSCMASDGDIDTTEVQLIKSLEQHENLFGLDDIEEELNNLVGEINDKGMRFLKDYLLQIEELEMNQDQEIQLVRTAVRTIKADEEELYSEIRFFKIIRSKLHVSDQVLLDALPEFSNLEEDYLQKDIISGNYLKKLSADYFDQHELPSFSYVNLKSDK